MEKYNDDDLGIIYLMGKKTSYLEHLYNTGFEECYGLGNDMYLFKSLDKNNTEFKMYNLSYLKSCNEPVVEILVKPENASITFSSFYIENKSQLIRVKYDDLEKNWDVRTSINGEEKISSLDKALKDLENLDIFGLEIKEKFTSLIDISKRIFEKSMEDKRLK